MNRVELEKMTGKELIVYADKLGVKVNCNKERTGLKESKAKVIDKIVTFEEAHKPVEQPVKSTKKKEKIKHTFMLPDCFTENSKYYIKGNYYKIKKDTRTVAEIYPQCQQICVYLRKDTNTDGFNVIKDDYKYYLPVKVFVPYDEIEKLEELIYER